MDFIKSSVDTYVSVLKQYTQFEGRARRSEFWKFTLVSIVIALVLDQVANILGTLYGLAEYWCRHLRSAHVVCTISARAVGGFSLASFRLLVALS